MKFNNVNISKDNNGIIKMWFDNDNIGIYQSIYNPNNLDKFYLLYFNPLMNCLKYININESKNCLIVGLGAGHIPLLLRSKNKNLFINIIEINEDVINAAKYMGFIEDDNMKIIIANGNKPDIHFTNKQKFDFIIIDLDHISSYNSFNFKIYFDILLDDGILGINCYDDNNKLLASKLKKYFRCIKYYIDKNNTVYLCKKNVNCLIDMLDNNISDKYQSKIILS